MEEWSKHRETSKISRKYLAASLLYTGVIKLHICLPKVKIRLVRAGPASYSSLNFSTYQVVWYIVDNNFMLNFFKVFYLNQGMHFSLAEVLNAFSILKEKDIPHLNDLKLLHHHNQFYQKAKRKNEIHGTWVDSNSFPGLY